MQYLTGFLAFSTLACVVALVWCSVLLRRARNRSDAERTFAVLHALELVSPAFRDGLRQETARRVARHLHDVLGATAVAVTDERDVLAWSGVGSEHSAEVAEWIEPALRNRRTCVVDHIGCGNPRCEVRTAVVAPVVTERQMSGAILALGPGPSNQMARALSEVARWASQQMELAELDRARTRLAEAELRALRSQISPHFIYNCLTTIASFVRTDPERARRLLLDFAGFARYAFRGTRQLTTLDEELRSIDRYLALERARFGERLQCTMRIAPEILSAQVPFLCLQPLVENAIRHGMEGRADAGHVIVTARDAGAEAHLSVEDDGVGMAPAQVGDILAGEVPSGHGIGLGNVDARLRSMFGDTYGLIVETGVGAGTKVRLRIPKFLPAVVE
ncbi:histidine kinase [Spiractinospora alimapuensis]|uniref:sensor histidine kinase n=1 Tax=Spiractinospora alimapuensis TaxID=2820884 RepID=UPI001F1D638E|nr:histidine kinase [Spiractinospora alimapuensis]QVQ53220.1 histidine kinase [Spiractinospora alimapuensis]